MAVKLNHTIIHSKDPAAAAAFYSAIFALPSPVQFGPFLDVEADNEVTLAFLSAGDMEVQTQHYAFLVSKRSFDQIFSRLRERGLHYWADPAKSRRSEINRHDGGRGCTSTTQAAICSKSSHAHTAAVD